LALANILYIYFFNLVSLNLYGGVDRRTVEEKLDIVREIETGSLAVPSLLTENRLCFASELTENKLIYGVEKETKGRLGHVAVAVAVT
jgi:hypothetical protein